MHLASLLVLTMCLPRHRQARLKKIYAKMGIRSKNGLEQILLMC